MKTAKFSITAFRNGLANINVSTFKEVRQQVENALVDFVAGNTPPLHVDDWKKAKAAVIAWLTEEVGYGKSQAYALQRDAFSAWGVEPKSENPKHVKSRAARAAAKNKGAEKPSKLMVKGWGDSSVKEKLDFILSLLNKLKKEEVTDGVKARCGRAITDLQVSN